MARLIPAGTGFKFYRGVEIRTKKSPRSKNRPRTPRYRIDDSPGLSKVLTGRGDFVNMLGTCPD